MPTRSRSAARLAILAIPTFVALAALAADENPTAFGQPPTVDLGKFKTLTGGYGGRVGSTRQKMLDLYGGDARSEAAVDNGLKWLAAHQAADGHWSLWEFTKHGSCACTGCTLRKPAEAKEIPDQDDIGATALALLPFLGRGETHKAPKAIYGKQVEQGLLYLLGKQGPGGRFGASTMYGHGLATLAVCEAYALSADPILKEPCEKGVAYIVKAQHQGGGWRYEPNQAGDTTATGWQIQALFAAAQCGRTIPKDTWQSAVKFLDTMGSEDGSTYGYLTPLQKGQSGFPTATAVALLSRQLTGWEATNPGLLKGRDYLRKIPPSPNFKNCYYYYHATQVMRNLGGEPWEAWNGRMRDLLIERQDPGKDVPHQKGSWTADEDAWGNSLGRLGVTALSLLTLEVYYRHFPIYRLAKNDK